VNASIALVLVAKSTTAVSMRPLTSESCRKQVAMRGKWIQAEECLHWMSVVRCLAVASLDPSELV